MTAITIRFRARAPARSEMGRARSCCSPSPIGVVPLLGIDYLFEAILTAVPGAEPRRRRAEHSDRLCRPGVARHGRFMAVGAFAAYNFNLRVAGLPLLVSIVLAGLSRRGGRPRLRPAEPAPAGFYLAVSTLAAQFFVQWVLTKFSWFSNDNPLGRDRRAALRSPAFAFNAPSAAICSR